jgi:5-methylcytosine-specific restriction endonuclease McrA
VTFDGERVESAHVGTEQRGLGAIVSWKDAHRELQRIAKRRATLDVDEARWIVVAKRMRVHVELGYATFLEYLERVLGYRRRVAFERVRVAEALETLPRTREMLEDGEVSYSVVREITRVAEVETEQAWLDAIDGKTIDEVERIVSGHAPGDLPTDPGDPQLEPRRWAVDLDPDVYALVLEARRQIEEQMGGTLDDNTFVAALCERALGAGAGDANVKPRYQIALTICERCERATQDARGQVIDVAPTVPARTLCDAEHVGHLDGRPERVTSEIPLKTRRHVLRRDHGRCRVPGCRGSKWLEIHHIVPRAEGGGHEPEKLVTLCGAHHRAHHEGKLLIRGRAPHDLVFEHPDGTPYGHASSRERMAAGDDVIAQATSALTNAGYKRVEADRAIAASRAHGGTLRLEDLLRAALIECGRAARST